MAGVRTTMTAATATARPLLPFDVARRRPGRRVGGGSFPSLTHAPASTSSWVRWGSGSASTYPRRVTGAVSGDSVGGGVSVARDDPGGDGPIERSSVVRGDWGMDTDTIAAIATPVVPQAGGVSIIRLSGPNAVNATWRVFRPASKKARLAAGRGEPPASHVALYGVVVDRKDVGASGSMDGDGDGVMNAEVIDEVLVLPMLAPRSYTTEDVVEIHCHGGSVCVQRVLALLLRAPEGAAGEPDAAVRLARPGEFTLRAFLNGRLDLTQAEAVQALVSAKTEAAADSALAVMRGGLAGPVKSARDACVDLLAELEARLDFDDEMEPLDEAGVIAAVRALEGDVADILTTARRGRLLDTGVAVAIVGRPNAGKSSLLNAWSRSERAIVTPVAGTTRDVVEAAVNVAGVPVTLLDTAGIRGDTVDEVEAIGVERSRAAAAGADAVVMVIDAAEGWRQEDEEIWRTVVGGAAAAVTAGTGVVGETIGADNREIRIGGGGNLEGQDEWANAVARLKKVRGMRSEEGGERQAGGKTTILAVNKVDTVSDPAAAASIVPPHVVDSCAHVVCISARRGDGLQELERALAAVVEGGDVSAEGGAWTANQRQAEAMQTALDALQRLRGTIQDGLPVDFWTIELREAALALGAITGDDITEDILDVIFTRFCIGK